MSTEKIELPGSLRGCIAKLRDASQRYGYLACERDRGLQKEVVVVDALQQQCDCRHKLDAAIASYGKAEREKAIRECAGLCMKAYDATTTGEGRERLAIDELRVAIELLLTPEPPEPTALETALAKLDKMSDDKDHLPMIEDMLNGQEYAAIREVVRERLEGKPEPETDIEVDPPHSFNPPRRRVNAFDKLRRISDIMDMEDGELLKAAQANQIDFVWCAAHLRCALIRKELER